MCFYKLIYSQDSPVRVLYLFMSLIVPIVFFFLPSDPIEACQDENELVWQKENSKFSYSMKRGNDLKQTMCA